MDQFNSFTFQDLISFYVMNSLQKSFLLTYLNSHFPYDKGKLFIFFNVTILSILVVLA